MSYYSVMMDGVEIFDPSHKETNLLAPRVSITAGEAGSFDFTFPANSLFEDKLIPYGSTIEVFEDGESVFYGRPLAPTTDFWGQKRIHCEGALAFLEDVICPPDAPGLSATMTDGEFYTFLINYYNSQQTRSDRKLVIGTAPTGGTSRVHEWSFQSCLDELKSDVLPYTGGIILTHRVDGETVIDWINEYTDSGNQPIKLGLNLLDLSATGAEIYTSAIAKGAQDDNGDDIRMSAPVKLSADIVRKYGDICVYLEYPTIKTVSELRTKCVEFLYSQVFKDLKFDISAVDIHALESEAFERFEIAQLINVEVPFSKEIFNLPITKIDLDLEKGTKNITVTSPEWAEQKMYIRSKYYKGMSARVNSLNSVSYSIPHITTNNLDYLFLRNPETGNLQSIQISGTNITAIELPEISLGDIDLNIGDILDFNLINVSVDGTDMSLNDFLNTYPNMSTNLADGYQLTDNDAVLTLSGNIGGYPYGESADTGVEPKTIVALHYWQDPPRAWHLYDEFDNSDYIVALEYSDGSEEIIPTSDATFSIPNGFVFTSTAYTELTVTYTRDGVEYTLSGPILFDGMYIRWAEIDIRITEIYQRGYWGTNGWVFWIYRGDNYQVQNHYIPEGDAIMYSDGSSVVITSVRPDSEMTGYGKDNYQVVRESDLEVLEEKNRSYTIPSSDHSYYDVSLSWADELAIINDRTIYDNRAYSFKQGVFTIEGTNDRHIYSIAITAIRVG